MWSWMWIPYKQNFIFSFLKREILESGGTTASWTRFTIIYITSVSYKTWNHTSPEIISRIQLTFPVKSYRRNVIEAFRTTAYLLSKTEGVSFIPQSDAQKTVAAKRPHHPLREQTEEWTLPPTPVFTWPTLHQLPCPGQGLLRAEHSLPSCNQDWLHL